MREVDVELKRSNKQKCYYCLTVTSQKGCYCVTVTCSTQLLACAVFVYGCWLHHNYAEYAELLAPSLYVDVSRIMIIVSLLAIANSLISVYGVAKELRCMIYSVRRASGG